MSKYKFVPFRKSSMFTAVNEVSFRKNGPVFIAYKTLEHFKLKGKFIDIFIDKENKAIAIDFKDVPGASNMPKLGVMPDGVIFGANRILHELGLKPFERAEKLEATVEDGMLILDMSKFFNDPDAN